MSRIDQDTTDAIFWDTGSRGTTPWAYRLSQAGYEAGWNGWTPARTDERHYMMGYARGQRDKATYLDILEQKVRTVPAPDATRTHLGELILRVR